MAEGASFADFLKDSREKKKNEALAQQFLGSRGRKANASGAGARPKPQKPDLLSRMSGNGIQKRSSSAKPTVPANIDGKWQHDLHKLNNPNGPPPKKLNRTASASQIDRNTRTFDKFASTLSRNAQHGRLNTDGAQLSIKGAASTGPHTLIASNFASGTTAQDIESVMGQIGGDLLSCRVVVPTPTVMAELTFATREGCDNVIATFNNKKVSLLLLKWCPSAFVNVCFRPTAKFCMFITSQALPQAPVLRLFTAAPVVALPRNRSTTWTLTQMLAPAREPSATVDMGSTRMAVDNLLRAHVSGFEPAVSDSILLVLYPFTISGLKWPVRSLMDRSSYKSQYRPLKLTIFDCIAGSLERGNGTWKLKGVCSVTTVPDYSRNISMSTSLLLERVPKSSPCATQRHALFARYHDRSDDASAQCLA